MKEKHFGIINVVFHNTGSNIQRFAFLMFVVNKTGLAYPKTMAVF
jgi:hypothetical protein